MTNRVPSAIRGLFEIVLCPYGFTSGCASPKQSRHSKVSLLLERSGRETVRTMRMSWGDDWPLAVVLAAAALMIAPLWLGDAPALPDYTAHLASFHLMAGGANEPVLSHFYHIEWSAIPNLAFEILVPALGRVTSLGVATKLLLSASVFLWV